MILLTSTIFNCTNLSDEELADDIMNEICKEMIDRSGYKTFHSCSEDNFFSLFIIPQSEDKYQIELHTPYSDFEDIEKENAIFFKEGKLDNIYEIILEDFIQIHLKNNFARLTSMLLDLYYTSEDIKKKFPTYCEKVKRNFICNKNGIKGEIVLEDWREFTHKVEFNLPSKTSLYQHLYSKLVQMFILDKE